MGYDSSMIFREKVPSRKTKKQMDQYLHDLKQRQRLEEAEHPAGRIANYSGRTNQAAVEGSEEPFVPHLDYEAIRYDN